MKGIDYMSQDYYILKTLNLKDKNIHFYEEFVKEETIKKKRCLVYQAYLTYIPEYCPKCGVCFDNKIEKHGFKNSLIKLPSVSKLNTYLSLNKQRYICNNCNRTFTCTTDIVNYGCNISNNTKHSIAVDLIKKRSEKDIAIDNNVSPNTVERVIDSYYEIDNKVYKKTLPEVLSFDEFKSVKSADGAMSFQVCNGKNGKIIDVVEDRKLNNLMKYFSRYSRESRLNVKTIVIDMYTPYISLIKTMFPNALIVIDKFHLIELISRSLNKTRIQLMKKDKDNYNKLKRYWKNILKSRFELNCSKWKKYPCFKHLTTERDIVNYLTSLDNQFEETYQIYQDLLYAFQNNDFTVLETTLKQNYNNNSEYMKTSIKTLKNYLEYINNTFSTGYHNGYVEGNNNFIKVLKRIAFGFRSFTRFKARIMICKGLISPKEKEVENLLNSTS